MSRPDDDDPAGRTYDAGTYGRSFADVYDDWYPSDADTAAAVAHIAALLPSAPRGPVRSVARVLELGVGTGRIALPLAERGIEVVGLDSSPEMLEVLSTKDEGGLVRVVEGDVADPAAWPAGPFDAVVATNNLLLNLADAAQQAACIDRAATVLVPGGVLVVEASVAAAMSTRERKVAVKEVGPAGAVLIVTDADPATGVVDAADVELRDGEPVRLRPWRVRLLSLDELDRFAHDAGLELVERHAGWSGEPLVAESASMVSVFRGTN